MFNSALNRTALADAFAGRRRLQIRDVLQTASAESLHDCLMDKVPWEFAFRMDGREVVQTPTEMRALPPQRQGEIAARIIEEARQKFQFAFFKFSMVDAYRRGTLPDSLLVQCVETLASQATIDLFRDITRDPLIQRVDAQATLYDAGNFLKLHNDAEYDGLKRRFAYVLNLSRDWEADWGGLLHFHDERGDIVETFVPRFNTLSLFAVPALHSVSFVAPYARAPRLAITGWFTG